MDTLLVSVTVLSLAIAAAMTYVAAKLFRTEQQRSEARVAALAKMSEEPDAVSDFPLRGRALPRQVAAPQVQVRRDALGDHDGRIMGQTLSAAPEGAHGLFAEHPAPSPWPRRLLAAGAVATFVVVVGAALLGGRSAGPTPATQVTPALSPLELVSLRYEQAAPGFVVTGLVQNPPSGAPATRVVATVFAFAQDGTFLASGRAPIEFTTLQPGDQSPFVVTVATTGSVARYRVGFRAEDGRVLAHVDKRGPESLARK